MARFQNPVDQFFDDAGDPLISGKLFFFATGTNTNLDTFADINLSIVNTNPVILTASARIPSIFLQSAGYNVILTDMDDVQIWQRDPIGTGVGTTDFSIWNSLTIYGINDIVEGNDGRFYVSITNNNQGNDPTLSPANWSELATLRVWNPNETYNVGNLVQGDDGNLYKSEGNNNLNNNPVSDNVNWSAATTLDIPSVITAASFSYAYDNF